ncbi:hypothetical protein QJS10_CPB22g01065 [Acorus calamus]|uniref:Uncharacterized protein n=1 Tax=Acorus calamus TaxID=4465 RepID=A0AAV9C178_ACOCL|nr:hypothetical protein QJS10_CPB22g01065 [Acorus calamus]
MKRGRGLEKMEEDQMNRQPDLELPLKIVQMLDIIPRGTSSTLRDILSTIFNDAIGRNLA